MTNILEKFHSQMAYDSQKLQQAIANYESFLFWCTEIRGMTIDEANYCWRHKNMNKKRFSQKDEDDWEILENGKHFAYAHSGYQAKKIIQELNELVETNRELYKDNKQLKSELNRQTEITTNLGDFREFITEEQVKLDKDYNRLKEENKHLKNNYNEQSVEYEGLEEQIERLLDFRDNVFNLINKKLKEADKGFEQTHDSWYQGQVDALKELKKELQKNDT